MPRGKLCPGRTRGRRQTTGAVTAERVHPPVNRRANPDLIAWIMQIMYSI
jgi:hypothetical protein